MSGIFVLPSNQIHCISPVKPMAPAQLKWQGVETSAAHNARDVCCVPTPSCVDETSLLLISCSNNFTSLRSMQACLIDVVDFVRV
jgi:hypothetical protein